MQPDEMPRHNPTTLQVAYALRLGHACTQTSSPRVRRVPETFVDHNRFR
jgi:hypothetical protein